MKRFHQYCKVLRWSLAIVMCLVCSITALAGSTKYYQAVANVSPSGAGTAYVSKTDGNYMQSTVTGNDFGNGAQTVTLFFKVIPDANHELDHWENADGTTEGNSNPLVKENLSFSSTSQDNPTQFIYTAVLRELNAAVKVQVAPGQENRGSVSINPSDNNLGNNVTLTATPYAEEGVGFLGWKLNNNSKYDSPNSSYSIKVSNKNKGTYYAHFSEPLPKVYCRLRNAKTGRFLSLYGNTVATEHKRKDIFDGFIFTNSLKMISETDAQGNPITVFLRSGTSRENGAQGIRFGHLTSAGVHYKDLVGSTNYPLTIKPSSSNGNYSIFYICKL